MKTSALGSLSGASISMTARLNLAVVAIHAGVLERVPYALLKIVEITTASIGRIQIEFDVQQLEKRLTDPPREKTAYLAAVCASFAAEERAVTNIPVIPVSARRERQHKAKLGYRSRGAGKRTRHDDSGVDQKGTASCVAAAAATGCARRCQGGVESGAATGVAGAAAPVVRRAR